MRTTILALGGRLAKEAVERGAHQNEIMPGLIAGEDEEESQRRSTKYIVKTLGRCVDSVGGRAKAVQWHQETKKHVEFIFYQVLRNVINWRRGRQTIMG